jgi:hypothetical protein
MQPFRIEFIDATYVANKNPIFNAVPTGWYLDNYERYLQVPEKTKQKQNKPQSLFQ